MLETSEIQIIHTELTNVVRMVTGIKDRLGRKQAQEQTDRRTKEVLQDRIVYLETEVGKMQEESGRLKALNDELISKIDGILNRERLQVVEIGKLIEERDDALDRLDKVEHMFKGIFHGDKPGSGQSPTPKRRDSAGDIKDKGKEAEKRVSWNSATQVTTRSSTPSPSIRSGSTERTVKAMSTGSSAYSGSVYSSSSPRPSSSAGRVHEIRIADPDESEGREWYIQTEKPPTTASSAQGGFELTDLMERLSMPAGEVMKLERRVIISSRLGPRLHIYKNFMFIFDPMWLELAEHTCLIDWGEKDVHVEMKAYLQRKAKSSAVFHIFSFPLHKSGWFYLGPHKIQFTELLNLWPQLRQEEKGSYVTKIKLRAHDGEFSEEDIMRMAENGELVQSTIEVWKAAFGDNVNRFVAKYRLG